MAKAAIGVAAALALVAGALWVDHGKDTTLPAPTGPFAVGRTTDIWVDAPAPGAKRELVAWIWYPSAPSGAAADYLPADWRSAVERQRGALVSTLFNRDLSRVHAHSLRDTPLSQERRRYPVVVVRPGLAALTLEYSTLAEDLASHGYVVLGIDAPFRTSIVAFPDGRVVTRTPENNLELVPAASRREAAEKLLAAWVADVGFAVDRMEQLDASDPSGRFTGRLDLQRIGAFGHSLGGATALQFCHDDARCKAGIDIDGLPLGSVIRDGLHQPFMFLLSDHGTPSDEEQRRIEADIHSIHDRLPAEARALAVIPGAGHFGFSDGAVTRNHVMLGILRLSGAVGIDGDRQLAETARYVREFFGRWLGAAPTAGPRAVTPSSPAVLPSPAGPPARPSSTAPSR